MNVRTAIIACVATAVVAITASTALPALAAKSSAASPAATTGPTVYQGKVVATDILIGPAAHPTLLVETPKLPAGTYLITSYASAIIGSHDEIVCAASNLPHENDGVFGSASNPGSGFFYGTASTTDTIKVSAGQKISLSCGAVHYGKDTWVGAAVVEALPVGKVN